MKLLQGDPGNTQDAFSGTRFGLFSR